MQLQQLVVSGELREVFLHQLERLVREVEATPDFGRGPGGEGEELVITVQVRRAAKREAA